MHQLDEHSQQTYDKRREIGDEILALAWGTELVDEDRYSAASDAISDVLTTMYGPAGSMVETSAGTLSVIPETAAREAAEGLLDHAIRSWEGDAEDYTRAERTRPDVLARRAFDVLTGNELSPSTRDLVTVEGIAAATWADGPGERVELLDVILAEYEAQAVEADNRDAIRAIVALREDCRQATAAAA